MATDIVLRSIKAAALTHAEMDQNWESLAQTVDAILANYTVLVTDQNKILECDIASGTITLLTLSDAAGTDTDSFKITIKNVNATSLIIDGNGGETIEGSLTISLLQNETVELTLRSDASEWNLTGIYGSSLTGVILGVSAANKMMTTDASNNYISSGILTVATINASTGLQITGVNIVGATQLNFTGDVTSLIQAQLDNKQPLDADLTAIAALPNTDSNFIVGNGSTWVAESGATARTSLGVDAAGTDNSTDVTLAGTPNYITIAGQVITRALINLASHVTGVLSLANGGTNSSTAAGAVTNLGFTATTSEINAVCDGNTATAAEITAICAGKTLTSSDDKIDNFPAATQMLFRQTASPTGWTKLVTNNDKAFRLVSGTVGSGGGSAFTTTFGVGKTTDSHTLLTAEIPAHTHGVTTGQNNNGTITNASNSGDLPSGPTLASQSTGGGGGHTHPLTNFDLQYVDVIEATKN